MGSKYQFAIEINSEQFSCKTGIIQFWINNNCIGKKEVTYIKPVLLALKRINNLSSFQSLNVDTNNIDIIFRNILNDEELCTQTLLGFGETFDDYLLRLYI